MGEADDAERAAEDGVVDRRRAERVGELLAERRDGEDARRLRHEDAPPARLVGGAHTVAARVAARVGLHRARSFEARDAADDAVGDGPQPGDHPEQRRLADARAAGEQQRAAALEPEREV